MGAMTIRQLADGQINGTLTDAEFAELERRLAADAGARREYLHYVFLHGELACGELALRALGASEFAQRFESRVTLTRRAAAGERSGRWTMGVAASLLVALACAALVVRPETRPRAEVATIAEQHWTSVEGPTPSLVTSAVLRPETVRVRQGEARIRFHSGAEVLLAGPTVLGVQGEDRGTLFAGQLAARIAGRELPFIVETPSVRIVDRGTEFGVAVNEQGETEVHVLDGEVEVQTRVRLPRHYWSFDDAEGVVDHAWPPLEASLRGGAQRVAGLVGSGAVQVDNERGSGVYCAPQEHASFVVSSGITVEALVVSRWSGRGWSTRSPYDYDEIFRKEDGHQRILLSFQNDHGPVPSVPSVPAGPCLAFGLNLAGEGYSELDMPLDGREGRPTVEELCDGQMHHIVATYDSHSGVKAIWIDGRERFRTQFPAGTMIVSGGRSPAVIGNLVAGVEPMDGIVDEVAFYDFALSADEIAQHYQRVRAGENYFGLSPEELPSLAGGRWERTTRLRAGEAMRFDARLGLPQGKIPLDRERFALPRRFE